MTAREWAELAFEDCCKTTTEHPYRHNKWRDIMTEYFQRAMDESRLHVYSIAMRDLDEEIH